MATSFVNRVCRAAVAAMGLAAAVLPLQAAPLVWSEPVSVSTTGYNADTPAFDGQGNAHLLTADSAGRLEVLRSAGTGGAWSSLGQAALCAAGVYRARFAVDAAGRVTVAYHCNGTDPGQLELVRYTPQGGWGTPAYFQTGPEAVFVFEIRADAAGNAVLVLRSDTSPSVRRVLATVFDVAQGVWMPPVELGRADVQLELLTLASDPAGNQMMALWLQDQRSVGGRDAGFVSVRYSAATRSWGAREALPGTQRAKLFCPGWQIAADSTLLRLDAAGNATLLANFCNSGRATRGRTLMGLRHEGGSWQPPVQVAGNAEFVTMAGFGAAAVDGRGVYLATQVLADSNGGRRLSVVRFTPGAGWSVSDVQSWAGYPNPPPVAWWGGGGDALVLQGTPQLQAWVSGGGPWTEGSVPPGLGNIGSAWAVRAPGGDVLAVMGSSGLPATAAMWLRSP